MTPKIRRADPARDAAACARIYAPYVTESWISFEVEAPDDAEMEQRIRSFGASHGWVVAVSDGAVIGYAYGSPHRTRAAYSQSCDVAIYVDRTCARRGVGRALYTELFAILAPKYHAAFAGVTMPNDPSMALHAAMGFERVGTYREVGWKMGGWRDVTWWQRIL